MSKYDLHLSWDRIHEARDLAIRWHKGEPVERTPFVYSIPAKQSGGWFNGSPYSFGEITLDADKAVEAQIAAMNWQAASFPDCDWMPVYHLFHLGEGIIPSMFGAVQKPSDSMPPFTEGRLLQSIEDVLKLPERIDPEHDGWGPLLRENVVKFIDATGGLVPVGVADHQSAYGCATKLLGNEALMMAMYDEPELVHRFLDLMTTAIIDTVEAVKRWAGEGLCCMNTNASSVSGKCGVIIWDDYISVLSPKLHMEFCAPQNVKLFERYGRGHLHTCGPYLPGYIDACLACRPVTMDISAMRGMSRSREDLLAFRRLTADSGVKLVGGIAPNAIHQNDSKAWESWDFDFLRRMAVGGLYLIDSGDAERGAAVARMCASLPQGSNMKPISKGS